MSVTHSGEGEEPTTAEVAADALDPLVGQTLDGRFRIVDVIGKGAMGKVYRAVQLPLNRAVALKVLDSRYGAGREESFKQRFLVEAALTSKLNHPNTVRVLDYGSTKDGLFFLAMEYLDGESLDKVLQKGPLPWHRVVSIAQQVSRALREAHELGVVHRDLKPGNVVLLHADDDADFVKVLDFGLVKSFIEGHELEGRAITQQGMIMGSPPYMAPEQGDKNRADPRSDIYSLGTVLFEMLTGKPPFTGGAPLEIILKHVHQPVPRPVAPQHFEAIPPALDAVVQKCLAKSPMDRFQSMDELLLALQDVATPARAATQELPVSEPSPVITAPEPMPSFAPPERSSGWLYATFALAIAVGVLVTWLAVRPGVPGAVSLHVETTPPGAEVRVEGAVLGATPLDLQRPLAGTTGTVEVELRKEGFHPARVTVTATGAAVTLRQVLVEKEAAAPTPPAPGVVAPESPPAGAQAPTGKPGVTEKLEPAKVEAAPAAVVEPKPVAPVKPAVTDKPEAAKVEAIVAPKAATPEPTPPGKVASPTTKIDEAFEAAPAPPPAVKTVKGTTRAATKKQKAAPTTTKPASKLDEDADALPPPPAATAPPPEPGELKRPAAN